MYPHLPTIPIVLTILLLLFVFQQFGTSAIGKTFGPIMLLWFSAISTLGILQILKNPEILNVWNPYYAVHLLTNYPRDFGFWALSSYVLRSRSLIC
ncbi:MAG: KUP/HAK/KT family potassium transporter [Sphingobacteriales bacterium]|nr:KUP/HAK/KT family potassium transporter [Sphingobacteriales bacterium]